MINLEPRVTICAEEVRLKTMIALESRLTHDETVKDLAYFLQSSMELRWNHGFESQSRECVFNSSVESKIYHIYTITMEILKSRNLIGTIRIAKFLPNRARFFRVIL